MNKIYNPEHYKFYRQPCFLCGLEHHFCFSDVQAWLFTHYLTEILVSHFPTRNYAKEVSFCLFTTETPSMKHLTNYSLPIKNEESRYWGKNLNDQRSYIERSLLLYTVTSYLFHPSKRAEILSELPYLFLSPPNPPWLILVS